ncbi:hypothetical protein MIND_00023500 [Mycena indigotica]|uniref:HMG box domain-containing protein n=1 Tax=Mycena indigotica TaxID=2126181 RepID=A0A8H6WHI0_9AGAR|nr:uncharacterized protein MIND_00023500 [Mycena indigotica]KAF7315093.1 hypothetical protein MIND_00023500 [Mycena indigotica]
MPISSAPTISRSASDSALQPLQPIRDADLPVATASGPIPYPNTKKSHARKQPAGHIPRPRNAFILFRCDYSRQKQNMIEEDWDQNDVSRAVGQIWRRMTVAQRAPWVVLAEEEKKRHAIQYPGYKYMPRNRKAPLPTEEAVQNQFVRAAERVVAQEQKVKEEEMLSGTVTIYYPPWAERRTRLVQQRRAVSCPPPGAVRIEPYTERVDRSSVKTSTTKIDPSEKGSDMYILPLVTLPDRPDWAVEPDNDHPLSIAPPNGTHWGPAPLSPTAYQLGRPATVDHSRTYSGNYLLTRGDLSSPDPSSPSSGSTTPPPLTPTDLDFDRHLVYSNSLPDQPDFLNEFGTLLQESTNANYQPVQVTTPPRESFLRTTYINAYEMGGYK